MIRKNYIEKMSENIRKAKTAEEVYQIIYEYESIL